MSTDLYALREKCDAAVDVQRRARRKLQQADNAVAACQREFNSELHKRKADPDDPVSVEAAVKRAFDRKRVDAEIRLVAVDWSERWRRVNVDGRFQGNFCYDKWCRYTIFPISRNTFSGYYMEAVRADDNGDRERRCVPCFDRMRMSEQERIFADRKSHGESTSVEDMLFAESGTPVYAAETPEARAERAQFADEWRALALPPVYCSTCPRQVSKAVRIVAADPRVAVCPDHTSVGGLFERLWPTVVHFRGCIACDDDTPATRLLVGWPTIRLCAAHFWERASLAPLLLRQAASRLRVESPY